MHEIQNSYTGYLKNSDTVRSMTNNWMKCFFTFSYPCMVEKILLPRSNFWNEDFDVFTRFEVLWIRKSHILALGLCIYLCYENNVKSNYRRNPKFDILHFLSHVNDTLNLLCRFEKCTEAHKRIWNQYDLWMKFLVSVFYCI